MFNQLTAPTWAEINLDNIKSNIENIKNNISEKTKICIAVKANAYGHGSVMISKVLQDSGVDFLAVARIEEAIELRQNNIHLPIICLAYIQSESIELAIVNDIAITIYSMEKAIEINNIAKSINKHVDVHIKIDTGMGRIGFLANDTSVEEIIDICKMEYLNVEGIYTHFSTADEKDKSFTLNQVAKFKYITDKIEKNNIYIPLKHASNSAGMIDIKEAEFDMVRCGIIAYGYYPSEDVNLDNIKLKPSMTLKTTVIHIKEVDEGSSISYGRKYITSNKEKIITLPIGYADGFTRMQPNPSVYINNKEYEVVGRICMDQCMVKIDNNLDIKVGDEVIIFGEEGKSVEQIAKDLNTINYEVLCMVSRRVDRVYMEGNAIVQVDNYLVK